MSRGRDVHRQRNVEPESLSGAEELSTTFVDYLLGRLTKSGVKLTAIWRRWRDAGDEEQA